MPENKDKYIDKSGDREFFTITPNIIINGYSAIESGVYSYIKRRAGENGEFYERVKTSAKRLKITKPTFLRIRNKFIKDGKLNYIEERKEIENQNGGRQIVKVFKITNIWPENIKSYKGVKNKTTLRPKGVKNVTPKGVKNVTPKKNPIEEDHFNATSNEVSLFNLEDYLKAMESNKNRHIQIIALYFRVKGFKFENRTQIAGTIKRNVRAAKELTSYSNERILKVMKYVDRKLINGEKIKWGLETVIKFVNENLMRLNNPGM